MVNGTTMGRINEDGFYAVVTLVDRAGPIEHPEQEKNV